MNSSTTSTGPAHARTSTSTCTNSEVSSDSSDRSGSPSRGRTQRRSISHSSEASISTETDATSLIAFSDDVHYDKKRIQKESLDKGSLLDKSEAVPDEYVLSVRAGDSIFFPMQVSSTLLWERSGWFKKEMSKTSCSGLCTSSSTGLISNYAFDSLRGKMIIVPFATSERLEQYLNLLCTNTFKSPPHFTRLHSRETLFELVSLYLLCVEFEDSISARLTLQEVRESLTHFQDNGEVGILTTFIWKSSSEGIEKEMQLLKRQFRNWGLKQFRKWLPGVIEWMDEEGKGPEDLEREEYTLFQRDVVYDYWMDQE